VPKKIGFKTKPEIALEQIPWACEAGLPRGVALMDVAYSNEDLVPEQRSAILIHAVEVDHELPVDLFRRRLRAAPSQELWQSMCSVGTRAMLHKALGIMGLR
jgi:SRSO17 transposase